MSSMGPRFNAAALTRFQSKTAGHLSFSLTLACPLRCSHCMVSTISTKRAREATMSIELAQTIARDMPGLKRLGIWRVSFTGGEPLLAKEQLHILSEAAVAAGIETTVVTACHWARTRSAAARTVAALPAISNWHLSTDVYHTEYLNPKSVTDAANAVVNAGKTALIRMAISRNPSSNELELLDSVKENIPTSVTIAPQPVSAVGKAKEIGFLPKLSAISEPPTTPCLTTGPLIRHDGKLLPCCSALAEETRISPFTSIDVNTAGIIAAVQAWRDDPMMLLVRSLGFGFPAKWATEELGKNPVAPAPEHTCDYCVSFWSNPDAREAVIKKLDQSPVQEKIRALSQQIFDSESAKQELEL